MPFPADRSFRASLDEAALTAYLSRQVAALTPDGAPLQLDAVVAEARRRVAFCFAHIRHAAFGDDDHVFFDHLHADQYCAFVYYASHAAYVGGDETLAKKLFLLNRALHGFHCLYDTLLPPVMWLNHALGTVIGRGTYGNYLLVTQNVTFGKDRDAAPVVGEGVVVYGGALIAGATTIGDRTVVAANASIVNEVVPPEVVVAGQSPNLTVKPRKRELAETFFYL